MKINKYAFPTSAGVGQINFGMTLRQYYASKIMIALIDSSPLPIDNLDAIITYAFLVADKMIAFEENEQ